MLNSNDINFWNKEKVFEIFNSLINKSKIISKRGDINVTSVATNLSTLQYFGHFALVGMLRINASIGDFKSALSAIDPIDFSCLSLYSKAIPTYLTLFYYAGFSYLMTASKHCFVSNISRVQRGSEAL